MPYADLMVYPICPTHFTPHTYPMLDPDPAMRDGDDGKYVRACVCTYVWRCLWKCVYQFMCHIHQVDCVCESACVCKIVTVYARMFVIVYVCAIIFMCELMCVLLRIYVCVP